MTVFTAAFSAVAISADQDIFELVPDATTRIRILEIDLGQYSDAEGTADEAAAEQEILSVTMFRGHTVAGSGGTDPTPANVNSYGRASVTAAAANNTTVATTSGVLLYASTWHIQAGFIWRPPEDFARDPFRRHFVIKPSERFVVRVNATTLADAVTTNGTVMFEEIGKAPVS